MFETFERVSTFLNLVKILNHIFWKRSKPHLLMILINLNKVAFYTKKKSSCVFLSPLDMFYYDAVVYCQS